MNKKFLAAVIVLLLACAACIAYLAYSLQEEKQANQEMLELAALEKKDMENEYQQFANQYNEMKTRINNDSIVAQLTREQQRTQELLAELKRTKANDAAEITRLKKELATVREILRQYVIQIDSLNQLNAALMDENSRVKDELAASTQQNQVLIAGNQSLSEKVAIASQLNATNIRLTPLNKKGKDNKGLKSARTLDVSFLISRNVTAENGTRQIFVRVTTPTGDVLNGGGSFAYANKQLTYSMKKTIEYTGQETALSLVWPINETLTGGTYNVSIFADGNMIGQRNFTFEK